MLELHQVTKRWEGFALREVTLEVAEGDYFVLLGPSGAGKSLFLELIAGFHRPDAGTVRLAGRDVNGLPPERRGVGFVYQDSLLFPHKTARQNIAYGPGLRGRPGGEVKATVERLAGMLHIADLLDRDPARLSGGEKQRVALARALAVEPRLLLLDEPLGALDPPTQRKLRAELKRVHAETGVTVLHVTHDQGEAQQLGRRIGILAEGRLRQVGEPWEVFERPSTRFVAEFTGSPNIYEGTAVARNGATLFRVGATELVATTRLEGPATATIRPENIFLSAEPVRTSARNQFAATVESVERRGRVYAVTGDCDGLQMTALVSGQSLRELEIRPGHRVYFSFKAHSLHLMDATDD